MTRRPRSPRALPALALVGFAALLAACSGSTAPSAGTPSASVSGATGTPPASVTTGPTASDSPSASGPASASGSPSASATIRLYFGRSDLDPCTQVVAVERIVAEATPEAALRALLKGPTSAEADAGYRSWFSATTADALASVTVTDGIARVSFHDLRAIIPNASSSCGSGMLLNELDSTLGQFPAISGARYSIEGDEVAFYEWLQRGVPEG